MVIVHKAAALNRFVRAPQTCRTEKKRFICTSTCLNMLFNKSPSSSPQGCYREERVRVTSIYTLSLHSIIYNSD